MGQVGGFLKIHRSGVVYEDPAQRLAEHPYAEFLVRRSDEELSQQGARCMECGVPFCHNGCPLGNLIPDWNDLVYHGRWEEAIRQLHETNNFPEFTGRLCPAPCEAACVLEIREGDAVSIKQIELSIIDHAWDNGWVTAEPPAHESGRSVIVLVNKWDAVTTGRTDGKPPADREVYEQQLRRELKYLNYAPVIFLSALEKTGLGRVMHEVKAVAAERRKRVTTGQMNRFLDKIDFQRAPVPMAKRIRIFYMTQAAVAPPTFVLFTDRDIKLHFAFERFLENQIREAFGFRGTPIWFKVRARNASKGE